MALYYQQMASTVERKRRAANQGPNLAPVQNLLEAQRIFAQYDDPVARKEVLKKVSNAIGSDKPLPILGDNLDKVFDPDSPLSDLTLTLTLAETKKRRI